MPAIRSHWLLGLTLCAALGLALPPGSTAAEQAPPGVQPLPPPPAFARGPLPARRRDPQQVFQGPIISRPPAFVTAPAPKLQSHESGLPINLATALRLADARPILIAAAQASVQVAAAELDHARVLWLPNLNIGAAYYRHDGGVQASSGEYFNNGRNQFMAGGGPSATIATTDAFFTPLAARQVLRSRKSDMQAARNDALLEVAEAYFNVQQARGRLIAAEDAAEKARTLTKRIEALATELVSPIEANRARTLLASLNQSVAVARGEWGAASAELTRVLRLNPTALVLPVEPPHIQVTLISVDRNIDELIPIGLTNRPELASQQALVQASLARLKQERVRPLMPSVVLWGDAVPTAPGGYLMGGVFASSNNGHGSPVTARNDTSLQLLWGLNNLGYGNRAMVRERRAEQQQALIALYRAQDAVAADVARAHALLESAVTQVAAAETGVKQGQISYAGNMKGLSETTRFGDVLVLVNRPQEVVAAIQQLADAYRNYFTAINEYNRDQFRLYRALGYPAGILACERSLGAVHPVDTDRPPGMAPVRASGAFRSGR